MQVTALPFLSCPSSINGTACLGCLSLAPLGGLPQVYGPEDPTEILEGGLCCTRCGAEYPILSGVAILVPTPDDYVRRYHRSLQRDLQRHGSLSPQGKEWLARRGGRGDQDDYGADFRFSQQFEEPWDVANAMVEETQAVYGGFATWLESVRGLNPYNVLAGWSEELVGQRSMILDAGCGGGGLVARLAGKYRLAFGIDRSFLAILLARRTVLHRPEAERTYFLATRRGQEVLRPLQVSAAPNAEFVVADCTALPFASGLFDAACSTNIIDIVSIDSPIREAARVIRSEGWLLLSDPFFFRDGEAPPGDPREAVRAAFDRSGLVVKEERDGVPWAWVTYDRHWRLYFNWCAAGRKVVGG